jgi:membrane AbrB-like protein
MRLVLAHLAQILIAALGGLIFHWLGVPAAWLSGAAIAATLWGLTGWAVPMPKALADAAMLISGAAMGAAVTPDAIAAMGRYPGSLMLLVIGVMAISAASTGWLVRISGWRKADAVLASVPGALSTVLAVAADRKAEVASIAIVQNFRLFVLIALLPSLVVVTGGGGNTGALIGEGLPIESPEGMAFILLGGLLLGLVFNRLKVAAPILLGATVVSSVSHGAEWVTGVIPPVIATGGLVLIGLFIAERFRNVQRSTLRQALVAALGSFGVACRGQLRQRPRRLRAGRAGGHDRARPHPRPRPALCRHPPPRPLSRHRAGPAVPHRLAAAEPARGRGITLRISRSAASRPPPCAAWPSPRGVS